MKCKDIFLRDPFVFPWDGNYYLYGTRSETAFTKTADGFDVYVSGDLENWDGPIEIFRRPPDFWATRSFWAPELHIWRGRFFLFATFSDGKRQGTAILAADSPLGPFTPWSDGTVTPKEWRCLDGTFYVDKEGIQEHGANGGADDGSDGVPYMVFCHEWKDVHDGTVCAVRLSEDLRHPMGEIRTLFSASQGRPAVHPFLIRNYVTDGPFFFRADDGRLHLLWSSYGKHHRYVQLLAHSDNNGLSGSWSVDPAALFDLDGGHGMIFRTFDGKPMLALHSPNRTNSEHPVFFPLDCEGGGLRMVRASS